MTATIAITGLLILAATALWAYTGLVKFVQRYREWQMLRGEW